MKKEIYKAYETMKPDAAAKERMLANILKSAADIQETPVSSGARPSSDNRKEMDMKKQKKTHRLQLAAALALVLIIPAAAAYATNLFGLRSISIGTYTVEEPATEGSSEMTERKADFISLQGMSDSPEAMACAEWAAFYDAYDRDGAIISQIGNGPTGVDDKYEAYNCYTQEMADKVDEICEKYQLSLLEGIHITDSYEQLCSQAGIGAVCKGGSESVHNSPIGGYYYEDGTLTFEGRLAVAGANACMTDYQFVRSVKGTFCPYYLNVENIDSYEQWEYTTENGEEVLLANSDGKALMIVEREESFIVVNLLGDIWENTFDISNETLEALTDSFDFSVIP